MRVLRVAGWVLGVLGFAAFLFERHRTNQALDELRAASSALVTATASARGAPPVYRVVLDNTDNTIETALPAGSSEPNDGVLGQASEVPAPSRPQELPTDERRVHFHQAFEKEAFDASWARSSRLDLESRIRRLKPDDATLESVDCRTTICRATIVTRGEKAYRNFMNSVVVGPAGDHVWEGPMFASKEREEPNGDWVLTIFFGQKGVEF